MVGDDSVKFFFEFLYFARSDFNIRSLTLSTGATIGQWAGSSSR
jgi:hypothetical protein